MNKQYIVVNTVEEANDMLKHIQDSDIIAVDSETTGLDVRSDRVIGFSVSGKVGVGYYFPLLMWNGTELIGHKIDNSTTYESTFNKAMEVLNSLKNKKLIMHNASYDTRIIANDLGVDLLPALYCDTIVLKHTVDEERPFGLKAIAKKIQNYIGLNIEDEANKEQLELIENIKANGGTVTKDKYELFKADMMVIGKYACADTDLTLRVFKYYSEILKSEGLEKFFYKEETMPLMKEVTIPMEQLGIPVDVKALEQVQSEISSDILSLEDKIQKLILPHLPKFQYWYLWNHYPPRRSGSFAQAICAYANLNLPLSEAGRFSMRHDLLDALEPSIYKDFLLGGAYLPDDVVEGVQLLLFEQSEERYMVNLLSKHHLKRIFFDILEEEPLTKTEKGNPQVNDFFLDKMAEKHEWVRLLRDYNKLNKLKSTYIDRILEKQEKGIFYAQWNMHRTTSGRLGGDLMQLPRKAEIGDMSDIVLKYNNRIRDFIIAGKDCKLVGADWNSLEVVVFADDAGDQTLLDMIKNDEDFYSKTAINIYGLQDKYSADKSADNFLKKHKPELRQQSKVYSLGIRYNMQAFKLSKTLNISQKAAEKIIKSYFKSYPKLKARMDELAEFAKKNGYIKSAGGRVRHLPTLKKLNFSYGDSLLDSLELWKLYNDQPKKYAQIKYLSKQYRSMLNNCMNFPVQSMAATICNKASIAIQREFKRIGISAHICMIIHDEIVVRCKDKDADRVASIVQYIMENKTKLKVPLTAVPEIGDCYGQIK